MGRARGRDGSPVMLPGWVLGMPALKCGMVAFALAGVVPVAVHAQRPAPAATPLVFDRVTVVDVERGKLVANQRVVVTGNRIKAVGRVSAVKLPAGAQVVDARGKYLIPGLWDMHVHGQASVPGYAVFLANGVTGIRDAATPIPLDTLRRWRQEILAGTRIGPPRQLFSGLGVSSEMPNCQRTGPLQGIYLPPGLLLHTCVTEDSADQRHFVDSLKAAGADMLKLREIHKAEIYFVMLAEARRLGLPVGGQASVVTMTAASDSGATIIDHFDQYIQPSFLDLCNARELSASVEQCKPLADRLRRNGTWIVPTAGKQITDEQSHARLISRYLRERKLPFDSLRAGGWLRGYARSKAATTLAAGGVFDSLGAMHIMQRVGLPMLAGTDIQTGPLGQGELHVELAIFVAEGITPLAALQSATLNPAKMLHATDSLGTVAPGKLADLVLLDADPLADITNTATVRAVVANGRYFDRAALDQLLMDNRTNATQKP